MDRDMNLKDFDTAHKTYQMAKQLMSEHTIFESLCFFNSLHITFPLCLDQQYHSSGDTIMHFPTPTQVKVKNEGWG